MVKVLVDNGANPNQKHNSGRTLIEIASKKTKNNENNDLLEYLLSVTQVEQERIEFNKNF